MSSNLVPRLRLTVAVETADWAELVVSLFKPPALDLRDDLDLVIVDIGTFALVNCTLMGLSGVVRGFLVGLSVDLGGWTVTAACALVRVSIIF